MAVAALIPAKAHSRRLPGKNLLDLNGVPLFCHSVLVARQARQIDCIAVSSDSPEVLRLAVGLDVNPIARPDTLCTDEATNFQVCRHAVEVLRQAGTEIDLLVLLQPTTPFRTPELLDEAVRMMQSQPEADSLVTVSHRHRVSGQIEDGYWRPATAMRERAARHLHPYEVTGHLFVLRVARTLDCGYLLGEKILPLALPSQCLDVDIDTEADYLLAHYAAPAFFSQHPLQFDPKVVPNASGVQEQS